MVLLPDFHALRRRFTTPPVTRFAPSPTGYLHLGHVANAIYVWGVARALGGRVYLRIEDHDRIRCRPEFEAAVLEDLDWLGFTADCGRSPLRRQSDAGRRYTDALDRLRRSQVVYGCRCSRREIASQPYDGRCRSLGLEGGGTGIRVVIGPGPEVAHDALVGPLTQDPARQCGDVLLRDRDGHWTYQFAVTVDDMADDVTLVIRGSDLVDSTGRQVALGRMLGRREPPLFLHHPLILDPDGRKLSKSDGDVGVRQLRDQGWTAPEVIGRAAAAVGLIDRPGPIEASAVHRLILKIATEATF